MPKIITFNGKQIVEPGAYSQILGGDDQAPETVTIGNAVIIDSGSGASYGFGSGISGDNASGVKSIYGFDRLDDFQAAVRGGILWDVAKYLFNPSNNGTVKGVNRLYIVRAAATTRGTFTFTFVGTGANGGTFTFVTKSEGLGVNGVLTSGIVTLGFGAKFMAGTIDTSKFKIQFYQGTFKGLDANSVPFDEVTQANSPQIVLCESPEFTNVSDLYAWAKVDAVFNSYFTMTAGTAAGTGVVTSADLVTYALTQVVTGGTETYSTGNLDLVLEAIREVDNTFFLADLVGDNAQDARNVKILTHIQTKAEFNQKFLYIGGGVDSTKFTQANGSIPTAAVYNTSLVKVVHSGVRVAKTGGLGYKDLSSLYHAAMHLGIEAGLASQTPSTWKGINIIGVTHELTLAQRETALLLGVSHVKNVPGIGFAINQDMNTLQKNSQQVYPDGQSPDGSVMRIAAELNRGLVVNARLRFVGKNAATASPADVKSFTDTYLKSRTASKTEDDLILSFKDVNVQLVGGDYKIKYAFVPNGPVSRLFFTGAMFSVNL